MVTHAKEIIMNCNNETVDFAKFEDVSLAFLALFRRFQEEVKSYKNFLVIKYACVAYANQKLSKEIKRTQDINSLFQLLTENKPHCNWLNIRFLEVIATASGNSKLTGLICDYKKTICSKTLREVWGHVPYQTVRTKYYSTLQAKFNGKDPDNMTVEQLKKMCECYLVEDIAMLISVKEENGLKITWLIPTNSVYHVYLSVLMLPQESRPDSSLQIGDWIVHRPLHILQHLHGRYWWISPSTVLIGYYHSLLMRDINADFLLDKMSSNGLLAAHDQELILTGQSMHHRNWLLLEHVRHMKMESLMKFCKLVQESYPQIGLQLVTALQTDITTATESQCYTQDKTEFFTLQIVNNAPSSLHILFLNLIDEVKELFQLCDASLLSETCKNLMASEKHSIKLFSDDFMKIRNYTNGASLLQHLSFLFTWSDHSILRALIPSSDKAVQLIDKFDSFFDPLNAIVSYPIYMFSLSMIPSKGSPYTLLAIRCDKELWQCSLQYVFNIKSTLVELCDITQHCVQLLAIQSDPTIFYWNIPKCVVKLISNNLLQHGEYLCSQGMVELVVYPKQLLFTGDGVTVGSLVFVADNKEVVYPVKLERLGSGLYGEVHRVQYNNRSYAGKAIHSKVLAEHPQFTSNESMSELQNHLAIKCNSWAGNLYHPNIEMFFEVVHSSTVDIPMILTELLTESLTVFVERTKGTIHVSKELSLCNDMAQGMNYLHSQSLVHGNLHGNNVLISSDGHAKIADYLCPLLFSDVTMGNPSSYLAPEFFQNETTLSKESNVFALGILFLQVVTKHPPQSRDIHVKARAQYESASTSTHHPLMSVIQQCIEGDKMKVPLTTHVCDELAKLIEQEDSPQRIAYKLLYTNEYQPLVPALTSGKRQKLQCVSCESMPTSMFWGYAVVNNKAEVYVTGGNSHSNMAIENVYKFSILFNQWDTLPSTGLEHGVPIMLNKKLSLIGGRRPDSKIVVSAVITYDDGGWISKYPDMIQPRYRPAVVTLDDHVIVLGGKIKHGSRSKLTDSIEIMNIKEQIWIKLATCLPKKMYDMQATVSHGHVWIIGYDDGNVRSNKVYSIPAERLTSNPTVKHSFKARPHNTLYYKTSAVPNSDPLIVLGGDNLRNKLTSAVVVFDPKTESWSEVASLSRPRAYFAVARVGECGMLIIGGSTETIDHKASSSSSLPTTELYFIE